MVTRYKLLLTLFILVFSLSTKAEEHLLFTSALMTEAKAKIAADALYTEAWNSIKSSVDSKLNSTSYKDMENLALTYLMTKDEKYAEAIHRILVKETYAKTWGSEEMLVRKPAWTADLGFATHCYMTALGFDAIRSWLPAKERRQMAIELYKLGVEPSMNDWVWEPERIHTLDTMGHNWWAYCVCMGGILGLALRNDVPEAAKAADDVLKALPEWFGFQGDVLQNKPATFDRNGGMFESVNYANFGISEALVFLVAYHNIFPQRRLPDIPQLKGIPGFFIHLCYPRTGDLYSVNFGDGNKYVTAENSLMMLLYLARSAKASNSYHLTPNYGNILWYLAQVKEKQHRESWSHYTPLGLLYWPDTKNSPSTPSLIPDQIWPDFGWAELRTSWQKNTTMLAVKSGYTWNHCHADANSFQLFHNGEDLLEDPHNSNYGTSPYKDYFFQSYAHNVVLFNGKGQPTYQQYHGAPLRGYVYDLMDQGRKKYLLANGTGPMSYVLNRNFRSFLWIDNVIFVIDDLHSHEPGTWEWLWHPNGKVKKHGFDLNVENGKAAIAIRPIFPRYMAPSNFLQDYPDEMWLEERKAPTRDLKDSVSYYSVHLPGKTDKVKGVTAIMLKQNPDDKDLPQLERREGDGWIGIRMTWHGKVTDIYINNLADGTVMHRNSWIYPDGWETDAYILTVTYDENSAPDSTNDYFVCYGSSLRRSKNVYYSSLTKQFVMVNGKERLYGKNFEVEYKR